MIDLGTLDFAKDGGTVTVVAQDSRSGAVLMVARADREALERTLATEEMHYRSRTRGLWHKGATSGNVQRVESLTADCDGDVVLARVVPAGPACHTGQPTCFGQSAGAAGQLGVLDRTIAARAVGSSSASSGAAAGSGSARAPGYTARLLGDRNLRLKKLGEEAAELAVACADGDRDRIRSEAADLVYHLLVAMRAAGLSLADLEAELARRAEGGIFGAGSTSP
ncbi:MAG: phosphoribosyl-ATP diphosphatase [Gemmatimonadales bacterium]